MVIITSIVKPEVGWPEVYYCPFCKKTEIVLNKYAAKPEKGDYFIIRFCLHPDPSIQFNHTNIAWGFNGG